MRVVKVLPFAIVIFLMGMNCIHGDPGEETKIFSATVTFRDRTVTKVTAARFIYEWCYRTEYEKYYNPEVHRKESDTLSWLNRKGGVEVVCSASFSQLSKIVYVWSDDLKAAKPEKVMIKLRDGSENSVTELKVPSEFLQGVSPEHIKDPSVLIDLRLEGVRYTNGSRGRFSGHIWWPGAPYGGAPYWYPPSEVVFN